MYKVKVTASFSANQVYWFEYNMETKKEADAEASYIIEFGYPYKVETGLYIPAHRIIAVEVERTS